MQNIMLSKYNTFNAIIDSYNEKLNMQEKPCSAR